ncbi:hypothetical protein NQZ68_025023 [Dissostichus eleginoides]|nr:hypothetical protein NQZ68_025023 [Dissostichus eleginoides]
MDLPSADQIVYNLVPELVGLQVVEHPLHPGAEAGGGRSLRRFSLSAGREELYILPSFNEGHLERLRLCELEKHQQHIRYDVKQVCWCRPPMHTEWFDPTFTSVLLSHLC